MVEMESSNEQSQASQEVQSAVEAFTGCTTGVSKTTSHEVNAGEFSNSPPSLQSKRSATATVLLLGSILLSAFVVALDRTIISTVWPSKLTRACRCHLSPVLID